MSEPNRRAPRAVAHYVGISMLGVASFSVLIPLAGLLPAIALVAGCLVVAVGLTEGAVRIYRRQAEGVIARFRTNPEDPASRRAMQAVLEDMPLNEILRAFDKHSILTESERAPLSKEEIILGLSSSTLESREVVLRSIMGSFAGPRPG